MTKAPASGPLAIALLTALASIGAEPAAARTVTVLGDSSAPIAGATVVFVNGAGSQDRERTDSAGDAVAPTGFDPVRARISAAGYQAATIWILGGRTRVLLEHTLPIIGMVRVATGTPQSLHALPVPASLLDRAAFAGSSAYTTDQVLRSLPGFDRTRSNSAFTNYGQLRVSFSGAGNDRGLVLADGVPAEDGFGGQIDWAAYPASTIERAELLRGAGSALYGAGAIGGVLELTTLAPDTDARAAAQASGSAAAGTSSLSEQWLNARAPLGGKLTSEFSAELQRLAYFDLPPGFQSSVDQIAQSRSSMASAKFRYQASPQDSLDFAALGAWDSQQEGRPNYTFARRLTQLQGGYAHQTGSSILTARAFTRSAFIVNDADLYPAMPGVPRYTQDVPTTESFAAVSWAVQSSRSTFAARSDYRTVRGQAAQYFPSGALQNLGSGNQTLQSIGAQETLNAGKLEIIAGARFDEIAFFDGKLVTVKNGHRKLATPSGRFDRAVSPRVAVRYEAAPQLNLRGSIGGGFRTPYLNELLRSFVIGPTTFLNNPSLVPERSRTVSIGADWANAAQRLSLDYSDTSVHDALMFRTISPNVQQRSNVAQTRTDGATLSYARRVGPCARVSASATAQNARVTAGPAAIVGKQLQYVPDASASVGYDAGIGSLGIGFDASYLGQTYGDDLNKQPLGTAVVAGLRVRLALSSSVWVAVTGQNVTGARYLSSPDRYGMPALVSVELEVAAPQNLADACLLR